MLILLLLSGALFVVAGCRPPGLDTAAAKPVFDAAFLGNAACSGCHANQCKALAGTRHALTLRDATPAGLADTAPPSGPVPLAGYVIGEKSGRFEISRQYPKPEAHTLDYAIGSGKTGMTYVTVVENNMLLEAKMSYFPHQRTWEITPGQEVSQKGDTPFGRIHETGDSRACLQCHAVALAREQARSAPKFYGVGCESCHGPGRAHVEAMQQGQSGDIHMQRLGKLNSAELNDLCGKCHRTLQQVDINTPMAEQTHRFQPFGLLRSRCRNAAGGPLSCLQCHDAHTDASTDRAEYNRTCIECHRVAARQANTVHTGNTKPTVAGKICPVNAVSNCIDCHMRPKKAFMISTFPGTMVDHLISIPDKRRKP